LNVQRHAVDLASSIIANQNIPAVSKGLEELREYQVEKPKKDCFSFDMALDVTEQITELYDEANHKMPWSSFSIANEGPAPVYYSVNYWSDPQTAIPVGQSIPFDPKSRGGIHKVFLKCDAGLTTRVALNIIK